MLQHWVTSGAFYKSVASRADGTSINMNLIFLQDVGANTILQDIARARENIQKSLAGVSAH